MFFLCCFYFLLKVHVNFSSVFYMDYRAVVTSSRHRPFYFHNFVLLLNCLFVLYNVHRIFVCVTAVSKSHEFLLKVRRLFSFVSTTTPTSSRRRVVFFLHDDARDSTSTTSRRFFHDVGHYCIQWDRPGNEDKTRCQDRRQVLVPNTHRNTCNKSLNMQWVKSIANYFYYS